MYEFLGDDAPDPTQTDERRCRHPVASLIARSKLAGGDENRPYPVGSLIACGGMDPGEGR
jgi:hypothetical protein